MYKLRNKYIYRDIEKEREKEETERERKREKKERHLQKEYQSKIGKPKNNKKYSNNNNNNNTNNNNINNNNNKQQNCYISNNSSNNDEMPYHNISSVTSELKCTEDSRYRIDEHLDKNNNGDNLYSRQHSCIMFSNNLPLDQSSPSHTNNNKYSVRKIYNGRHNKKMHSLKFNNDIKSSSSSSSSTSSSSSSSSFSEPESPPAADNKKSDMVFTDTMDINKSCMDSCFGYTDYIDESENVSNETVIITKSLIKENSHNRYQYKFTDVNDENYLYVNYK